MKIDRLLVVAAAVSAWFAAPAAIATGLVTCDSGPEEGWQDQAVLQERLEDEGWTVRRIKVDGGCFEVYALDAEGERVEAYFHPETLEPVPIEDSED